MNFLKHKNWQLFLVGLFLLLIDFLLKGNDLSSNVHKAGGDGLSEMFDLGVNVFELMFRLIWVFLILIVVFLVLLAAGVPVTIFLVSKNKKSGTNKTFERGKNDDLPVELLILGLTKKLKESTGFSKEKTKIEKRLLEILSQINLNSETTLMVFFNLNHQYKVNIVNELKSLSNNYNKIKKYLYPFICHGICEANYPHKILVTH